MIHHFFLPHKTHKKNHTHNKAHLLSHPALGFYIALFVIMQMSFKYIKVWYPGVLGTTSAITTQEIISLTNVERQKAGLGILKENSELDKAAQDKAKNMFAENYWAHVSPSGKSPWVWIQQEGYNYTYAGENLARSFSNSNDVMDAWMASKKGHKENILNSKYQEIGTAVEDGVINGEKLTLVVQLFGTPTGAIAAKSKISGEGVTTIADKSLATTIPSTGNKINSQAVQNETTQTNRLPSLFGAFTINPYALTRTFSFWLIVLLTSLGLIDLYVMWRKKQLARLHMRHLPHISVISIAIAVLLVIQAGSII